MNSFYWNLDRCDKADVAFNIICGGRGTGKTYSVLRRAYETAIESELEKIIYVRRTDVEVRRIVNKKFNPYKSLNRDFGWTVSFDYDAQESSGNIWSADKKAEDVKHLGYTVSLSTFDNFRGADIYDVSTYVFDEFIKPANKKQTLKDEADIFFNSVETIARNRELQGRKPLKCYLLTNATKLDSPILNALELVPVIEHMMSKGQRNYTDKSRELHIELLPKLGVSVAKEQTALYKLTRGTNYYAHAIENEFAYDSFENIVSVPLMEYIPTIHVNGIYIYRHKSNGTLYASRSAGKCIYNYVGDAVPKFKRDWGITIYSKMLDGAMAYSSFDVKSELYSYFVSNK